ncbi:Ala-tRNA(Pro) deacylase [Draconibacterium orientale]|uniref:Ala-tRNA(Pro) deacylase n=1 Tax=Draconibacterium orientale TaxID=1168034 RepID=X5DDK7_9BACT|nr:YbaK/EbsC family protein [Draconibacterium orientale]AHW60943.1 prolyl-tRNA synthetase [Draconibacterium orientale]SES63119.1 Ala-tRNA(Pro) deacylase [Draconibacterium orientale]
MPVKKLKAFLDENDVKYTVIRHSSAFTAQEIAAKSHISGKEVAKTVIVNVDGKMAMTVLPASYQVDFELLKDIFGSQHVNLATEAEFQRFFPDCEIGAMPPFGNLYDMEVFVAETLAEDEEIAFNAGNHTEMIKMSYADFERMVEPRVFKFSWKTVSMPGDPSERWAIE